MGTMKLDVPMVRDRSLSEGMCDITTRSPKESPPIEKKRLKRLGVSWHGSSMDSSLSGSDENLASLSDGLTRPKSILRRVKRYPSGKHVQFNAETFVQHVNGEGTKTEGVESLCTVEKDRKAFMSRNLMRMAQNQQMDSLCYNHMNSHSPPHYPQNQGLVFSYQDNNNNAHLSPEVHISFNTDTSNQGVTRLKMLVNVGAQFQPDEICVKANVSGNKIRVMATKLIQAKDGSHTSEPFNERFLLPMEVDPYAVEARLDSKGNLTIEAPLMTHSRKSGIAKSNSNQATKSL